MKPIHHSVRKLRKKLTALAASLALLAVMLPGALAVDMNVDAGFYFKQSRGGTCTLTSAAIMLRLRAYLDGMDNWTDFTENGIRSSAWSNGLSHSFTYQGMHVGYATLPSGTTAKKEALIRILAEHPEGVVLYDRTVPHAVILTDYTDGVFYCSDPAGNISAGRVPLSSSMISLSRASCYWYIASDGNSKGVELLELEEAVDAEELAVETTETTTEEIPASSLTGESSEPWGWFKGMFQ